ncbi:MAG: PfkB family carbohydrate kinase, partial [Tannerella sp.]|nr:PfkB family carbohydrate kinase [Tannerella sp.]
NDLLFLPILKRAKSLGLKIALDLSNFNIVSGFKDLLKEIIPACVDILFSNESEAEAYTGLSAREAIDAISKEVEVSVVTIGKEGALASAGGRVIHEKALSGKVVDTTGAGDNFAAGFLYGYSQGATMEQSVRIGSLLAGNVIEVFGPQIAGERWEQIKLKVSGILKK